ncbi:MAG: hypothetical protein MK554_08570 [Planctomycetes bacterium]|nr:hypothetical protein [Planctomycetota bacterium]
MADNYDRLRWGGLLTGSCRLAVLSLVVAAASGCGGVARKPSAILEKYFPSQNPEQALVGFVFAIESGSWDAAYTRLSKNSREKIGSFKFKVGLPLVKDPRTGISVLEIITGSITNRTPLPRAPGQPKNIERIQLDYYGKDSQGRLAAYFIVVYLLDEREQGAEEPAWKIDLLRTAEQLAGPQAN